MKQYIKFCGRIAGWFRIICKSCGSSPTYRKHSIATLRRDRNNVICPLQASPRLIYALRALSATCSLTTKCVFDASPTASLPQKGTHAHVLPSPHPRPRRSLFRTRGGRRLPLGLPLLGGGAIADKGARSADHGRRWGSP